MFVDVQQLEDQLDIGNIVVARNEAEIRVSALCIIHYLLSKNRHSLCFILNQACTHSWSKPTTDL